MADLRELLGDGFKEEMTLEEIDAALAEKDFVGKETLAGYVPKNIADKYATEAANYKKKWKATQTEVERKSIEESERQVEIENELKALRRTTMLSKYEKEYVALGYDDKMAQQISGAMCDGDMDTVFNIQKKFYENQQKTIKADLMKQMPNTPSGNETKIDYSKQIAEAQSTGNMVLLASLIRQQTEANAQEK